MAKKTNTETGAEATLQDEMPLPPNEQIAEMTAAKAGIAAAKTSQSGLDAGAAKVDPDDDGEPEVIIVPRSNYAGLQMGPNTWSFQKGVRYKVPYGVADHLRQLGVI